MLIDRGVSVALATDVNPGGGFSPSMPFAMTLACFGMHMTLEESLMAATLNAAGRSNAPSNARRTSPMSRMR
jgi:imidazolonepropionase